MKNNKIILFLSLALALSVCLNLLALAGAFSGEGLRREKDALLESFSRRVRDLEEENRRLAGELSKAHAVMNELSAASAWAREKLSRVKSEFEGLKNGGVK